jgi:hypothetical protein
MQFALLVSFDGLREQTLELRGESAHIYALATGVF